MTTEKQKLKFLQNTVALQIMEIKRAVKANPVTKDSLNNDLTLIAEVLELALKQTI